MKAQSPSPAIGYHSAHLTQDPARTVLWRVVAALLRSRGLEVEAVQGRFLPYSMRGAGTLVKPWLVRACLRSPVKPFAGQMLVIARKSRGA